MEILPTISGHGQREKFMRPGEFFYGLIDARGLPETRMVAKIDPLHHHKRSLYNVVVPGSFVGIEASLAMIRSSKGYESMRAVPEAAFGDDGSLHSEKVAIFYKPSTPQREP